MEENELTRYWGRLFSVEGRALGRLGSARLTVTLGTRAIKWNFIGAEIGDDEGILGNDFAMAHELMVRPCEGAVYGTAPAMHHPLGHGGTSDNRGNPCSSGCGTGDAGTTYHHPSVSGPPYPRIGRNGDD